MQRDTTHLDGTNTNEDLAALRLKYAEELAYQAKIYAYLDAQKNQEHNSNPFALLPFPRIAESLPLSDIKRFAYTCRAVFFSQNMQPVIKRALHEVHQFLVNIKNANLSAVLTMIHIDPGLLFEKTLFGEHGKVTGLQLAMRMGDVNLCKIILKRLQELDDKCNTNHKNMQIKIVTTNTQKKAPFDVSHFDKAADAIARNRSDANAELTRHRNPDQQRTNLSNEMDTYRSACDKHGEFTADDLINVFYALVRNAGKFKTYEEFDLYFLQVMGYVARKVPLYLRLAMDQGMVEMMQDNFELNRNSERDNVTSPYSLTASIPNSGLGFDCCLNFINNRLGGVSIRAPRNWFYLSFPFGSSVCLKEMRRPYIEEFSQATDAEFAKLMLLQPAPDAKKKKRRCC